MSIVTCIPMNMHYSTEYAYVLCPLQSLKRAEPQDGLRAALVDLFCHSAYTFQLDHGCLLVEVKRI